MTLLGQKSVQCGRGTHVIDAVLQSLLNQLRKGGLTQHFENDSSHQSEQNWLFGNPQCQMDPKLISWLLLFLSLCLDLVSPPMKQGTEGEKGKEGGEFCYASHILNKFIIVTIFTSNFLFNNLFNFVIWSY